MTNTVYCEVLERYRSDPMRVDLWFAQEKDVHWVEIYYQGTRILKSQGFGQRELAEQTYKEAIEQLPAILQQLGGEGPGPGGFA